MKTHSMTYRAPLQAGAGFTLIELMITVLVIAILAAIAYPSYRNYALRGQLVNATNGLSAMQANMERFFQDNRTYMTNGAFTSPCLVATVVGPPSSAFTLSCSTTPALSATSYQLQAVGSGSTTGFTFFVNQAGTQWTTVAGVKSWAGCTSAWVTSQSLAC